MAMRFTGHFNVTCHPDRFDQPLHWKKPRRIFVCSMGDLFHEDVLYVYIGDIHKTIEECPQHTFLILTKRPERALQYYTEGRSDPYMAPNLWLGVTAENQEWWEKRKEAFFATPAAIHFVSNEPLLGEIVYTEEDLKRLDWVIVGAESGPGKRGCNPEWIREVVEQCRESSVPVFVKQVDRYGKLSKNPSEWPEDLRVREYPDAT